VYVSFTSHDNNSLMTRRTNPKEQQKGQIYSLQPLCQIVFTQQNKLSRLRFVYKKQISLDVKVGPDFSVGNNIKSNDADKV